MGIFDMTNLTWGFDYNPDATPYARSNVVKDYHTSAKSPFPGTWSNTTLSAIFEKSTLSNVTALRSPTGTSGVPPTGTPSPDGHQVPRMTRTLEQLLVEQSASLFLLRLFCSVLSSGGNTRQRS